MEYRQLGTSGLKVSTMTMGTMAFGGQLTAVGNTDLAGARRQFDLCRDHGVNLVDTADAYSSGLSEEIVGEALASSRDQWLIGTKVRFPTGTGPNDAGLSRHHILEAAEASLRRLRVDHIDLYQVHEWDGLTPLEETLTALDFLVQQGKVRYIGLSNYNGWQLMKALAIRDKRDLAPIVSQQIYYSLISREVENELLPIACDQGLGVLVWSPLAGGLLSGKYARGANGELVGPSGARRLSNWDEPPITAPDRCFATLKLLNAIAAERNVSGAQIALAWLLTRPTITSLVVGARNEEQLADNLAASELTLSDRELRQLEQVSRPPLLYPYWHSALRSPDRHSPADRVLLAPYLAGSD